MKPVHLPHIESATRHKKRRSYALDPMIAHRRRRRNQRIGDMILGAFFFAVAWMVVYIIAGAW